MSGSIAPFTPQDAAAVAALLDAVPELPSSTEESFRSFAALSFNRGARDFRVVRDGDHLCALLTSTLLTDTSPPLRHFRIVVHPEHRRRGIASRLLAEVAAQEGASEVRAQCNSQDTWAAGNAFLEGAGFHVAYTELLMSVASPSPSAATSAPEGVVLRPARPSDDHAWIQLHHEAYSHMHDFHPLTAADLVTERAAPGFAMTVAEAMGEVLGYCHVLDLDATEGLINSVVVAKAFRRQGLGQVLLHAGVQGLFAGGVGVVSLNVAADNTGAARLYERYGFETYDKLLTYQRTPC